MDGGRHKDNNTSSDSTHLRTRKRTLNSDGHSEEPRKKLRTDIDPMCTAIDNMELKRTMSEEKTHTVVNMTGGKGRIGKRNKGKGKWKAGEDGTRGAVKNESRKNRSGQHAINHLSDQSQGNSVEELLASGKIQQEEVSQILFRLPDGSRVQKSFLCNHPIRVSSSIIFTWLQWIHSVDYRFHVKYLAEVVYIKLGMWSSLFWFFAYRQLSYMNYSRLRGQPLYL